LEESFRREAEMLAQLRHPSLPAIVDSFVEGTRHYLVMEYIPGATLSRHIEESGPVSHEQALQWGLELAEVLSYLHAQSPPVIFRDLKPDNVLVSEGKRLKLVDFGLARHFRPGQSRDTQAAGSIGYSSPEQWEDRDQSDQRSDIYGWGAVMHFLLSGKPPSATYGQQKLIQFRPDLDARLEALVLKVPGTGPGPALSRLWRIDSAPARIARRKLASGRSLAAALARAGHAGRALAGGAGVGGVGPPPRSRSAGTPAASADSGANGSAQGETAADTAGAVDRSVAEADP